MREQSCSIPRGLKINKNSAEGEVFLVDFPSYRTLQDVRALSRSQCLGIELADEAVGADDEGGRGVPVFVAVRWVGV
jgi:hypothetical protein